VTTASDGSYTFRIADLEALAHGASSDGLVNFETVAVATEDGVRQLIDSGFGARLVRPATGSPFLADPTISPDERSRLTPQLKALPLREHPLQGGPSGAGPDPTPSGLKGCTETLYRDLGLAWDIVGQTNATFAGVNHDFVYSSGASSSLGWAINPGVDPYGGTWSQGGTEGKSSTATLDFAYQSGAKHTRYKTQFHYGMFRDTCVDSNGFVSTWFTTHTISWAGGSSYEQVGLPSTPYCVSQHTGDMFYKTNSTQHDWTNGFNLSAIGIKVETTTGWNTDSEAVFHFYAPSVFCGGNDYPAGPHTTFLTANQG
jgi:hypothetical protein